MPTDDSTARIQVDSDWKAQAQAEKERLAQREDARAAERADHAHKLPEASFKSLVGLLASQAVMGLGSMTDPKSGGVIIDLEGARFSIDLLGVVEEKTTGNLTKVEADDLKHLLSELRSRYVEITQLLAQAAHKQHASPVGPASEGSPPAASKSKLIIPD